MYSSKDIAKANNYTPEVFDDTYINMEITLLRDSDGLEFVKVTKRLRDKDGILIRTANDNPILDSRVYEIEYLDGNKVSLAANSIAENLFAQVDKEGNRHVLMDTITNYRVDSSQLD